MIPQVVAQILSTMALLGCLTLAPLNQLTQFEAAAAVAREPDAADVALISRTIWGEVRGCCVEEQRAQAWCILNRVDDPRWPDSIEKVVTAPYQFQGYSPSNPEEPFHEMAREILIMWNNGEREIPADMVYCSGDGKHQTFRNTWERTAETRYWP